MDLDVDDDFFQKALAIQAGEDYDTRVQITVDFLDEADFLTIQAQASLRNIIETFARTTRFILTCNYIERIIDPLQSRCQVLKIIPPSKQEVAYHIMNIIKQENVGMGTDDLKLVVNQFYPDIRKMLNTLQMSVNGDEIVVDKSILVSNSYKNKVLAELCKPTSKSFNNIRQIIADSNVSDFEDMFRFLYDNVEKYAPLGPKNSVFCFKTPFPP